jgi:hypothetical protein
LFIGHLNAVYDPDDTFASRDEMFEINIGTNRLRCRFRIFAAG